ncbi:magnesium transporter, partial [Xylella fastidiosa subsp. multiplex]|nr:magnesium transporter [Xylella fastidiosa subsp. multiplex]
MRESLLATMDMEEIIAAVGDLDIDKLTNVVDDLPNRVIDKRLQSMDGA